MRTAKCIAILLIVVAAGLVAVAREAPQGPREPSGTRAADCLVRITVDPDIIPLNPETVTGLLYSSAVLGKAAREVLGSDAPQDPRGLVSIQWLSGTARGPSENTPESLADRQMLRQLRDIYGREYLETMTGVAPKDGQGAATEQNRQDDTPRYGSPYGGYEDRGVYGGVSGGVKPGRAMDQGATIKLSVRTPDEVRPVAREFLNALVENLRASLTDAFRQHLRSLDDLQMFALSQRQDAEKRLERAAGASSPAEASIREQLDQVIDFSAVTAQTPLREAIEILKNSVAPPLPIVVQWNRLENMSIPPSTMAGIDGPESVRLGTALDLLVKSFDGIGYRIQDDVIAVAPVYNLPPSGAAATKLKEPTDVRALAARKNELARNIQSLELDLAGMEARRKAIQEQIAAAEQQADKQLADDAVIKELKTLLDLTMRNLDTIKKSVDAGRVPATDLTQAMESMTRARIELARRRDEVMKPAGGGQFAQYNAELSDIAIDRAEKKAQLDILGKRLDEVQRQLAQASTFDPEAARIRIAQETLDAINRRIGELETRLATLKPPAVVVIGAN